MRRVGVLILLGLVLSAGFPISSQVRLCKGPESASDTAKNSFNIYFGDLHSHTNYSDGVETPEIAYRYARDVAKVDFLAVTDHARRINETYVDIRAQASLLTEDGVFVAIAGQEWNYADRNGHVNVFEADHVIPNQPFPELYRHLKEIGCMAQFNHPGTTNYDGFSYDPDGDGQFCLHEVINPSSDFSWSYFYALSKGWHVGAAGNTDTHRGGWGMGPWTGVLATNLTKEAILDGLRHMRTYATRDRNLRLFFRADEHWMGESFLASGTVEIRIDVEDPDRGDVLSEVRLYMDGVVVNRTAVNNETLSWTVETTPTADRYHYYVVGVKEKDGENAWSSPIWIRETPAGGDADRAINEAQQAVDKAKGEGRTVGLADAETLLAQARQAHEAGEYVDAIDLANQAKGVAEQAKTVWEAYRSEILVATVFSVVIGGLVAVAWIRHRRVRG